jgi:hypothetical protein
MGTLTWFGRVMAAAVTVGCVELATLAPVGATETINQYGYWSVVTDTDDDGSAICGVRTAISNGGELRLMVIGNQVHMVARNPAWTMRGKGDLRIVLNVDGESYGGSASIVDPQTLVVVNLSRDFLADFMEGNNLVADFGSVRWAVSLAGSSRATSAMGECVVAAQRGYAS